MQLQLKVMESRETSELQQLVSSDAENEDSIVQDDGEGKVASPIKSGKVVCKLYCIKLMLLSK